MQPAALGATCTQQMCTFWESTEICTFYVWWCELNKSICCWIWWFWWICVRIYLVFWSPFLFKNIAYVGSFVLYDDMTIYDDHHMIIWWWWHIARIISSHKIYGLYGLKHHIVEIRGDVTMRDDERTTEDRATQPKWKLEAEFRKKRTTEVSLLLS